MPETYLLAATDDYPLGNSVPDNYEVGIISFQVEGSISPAWSGSAVVEARQFAGGLGWVEVPYYDVETKSTVAAGTPITADGLFEVDANGREIRLAYTHTDGSATVVMTPMRGRGAGLLASSGGGVGTDVNLIEVGGAAIALGQDDMAGSFPVVIASDQTAVPVSGNVGGYTTVIKPTVTVSTTPAYSPGDDVGGKITISNAVRVSGGTGYLQSVTLLDAGDEKAAMTLYLFDSDPSAATITDNTAFAWSTDFTKCIGQVTIATADYITTNSKAIAKPQFAPIAVKAASGTTLYAALVTTSTPTYSATSDIALALGFLQD